MTADEAVMAGFVTEVPGYTEGMLIGDREVGDLDSENRRAAG